MLKKTIIFTLLLQFGNAFSQTFSPPLTNYTIENYKAANQNWDIDIDKKGVVFVANNDGMLVFNGQKWVLYQLPNKGIIRSILCHNNRVYTGSYEDFGFWIKNKYGIYEYTSLKNKFDTLEKISNEQFWNIIEYKNLIFFRSFARGIYSFDGNKINYISDSQGVSNETIYQGELIMLDRNLKIKKYHDNKLVNFQDELLKDDSKILNLKSTNDILFFLKENGKSYLKEKEKLISLPLDVNSFLKENILNKVSFSSNHKVIFGTIKKGVLIYDYSNEKIEYISKKEGLNNSTILSLKYSNGYLWGALDNGITRINLKTPMSFFSEKSGVLGTVYDVKFYESNYYLASNTGVYTFNKNNELKLVINSEGQTWGLNIIDNDLIANHNTGTYLIKDNQFFERINTNGVFRSVEFDNKIIQGTYYGLNYLEKTENKWISKEIKNIPFLVDNIVFENKNTIWISHPHKGLYRIKLNNDYNKAIEIKSFREDINLNQYKTNIYKIKNQIIFYNNDNWFSYNKQKNTLEKNNLFGGNNKSLIINKKEKWLINKQAKSSLVLLNKGLKDSLYFNLAPFYNRLVTGYEKINSKNDSIRILNLNDGFATFNINDKYNSYDSSLPLVQRIYSPLKNYDISNLKNFEISYDDAAFFKVETFFPNDYDLPLNYFLTGEKEESNVVNNGEVLLQNLSPGEYDLFIKTDLSSKKKELIHFKVLPPWYYSNLMKFIYLIIILLIIYYFYYQAKKRIKLQQLKLHKEYVKRTKERINRIEKENLQKQIDTNKKELISSTVSIIKRNEVILSLRRELTRLLAVSNNKIRTERLIKLSKDKIEDESEWKEFEKNFKKLHEDFFKKLITTNPKLTTKDLKLCAYIKMGFSTKEIAPLLGIEVRSVEIQRYRLRKKLSIKTSQSIYNYLLLIN